MPIIDEYGSRQDNCTLDPVTLASVGVVTFRQQEAREIGTRSEHGPGHRLEARETPVRMTFDKVESIDVVIRQLQKSRR